jgi:CheY-like chemotaxis protein
MSGLTRVPFRILWIEDQLTELEAGVKLLSVILADEYGLDAEIIAGFSVEQAVQSLETLREKPPTLMILDIMVPRTEEARKASPSRVDMNAGLFVWYRLRRRKEWGEDVAQIPILVLTARSKPEFRAAMEEDEKVVWLEKPVTPSELAKAIAGLVSTESVRKCAAG